MPQRARGETQSGRRGARQSRASARTPSIADGTALHCGRVGSRHFESLEIRLGGSLFVSLGAGGILSTTCDDYLLACP